MATARTIIRRTLRKLGVLGLNQQADAGHEAEALEELQSTVADLLGFGAMEELLPRRIDASYEIDPRLPGLRLLCVNGGVTVTLPKTPADGARVAIVDVNGQAATSPITLARNGFLIEGAAADLSLNTASVNRTYVFRADLGDWRRATDIAIDSALPFPDDLDDSLVLIFARQTQGLFNGRLTPPDAERARAARQKIRGRYVKPGFAQFDSAISTLGGAPCAGMSSSEFESYGE